MRKLLKVLTLLILATISVNAYADIGYYQTTEFAMKTKNAYGYWGKWTDWESSSMLVVINFDDDIVTIHSPSTQTYRIIEHLKNYTDNNGGNVAEFAFIDQDGDRGHMRLRIDPGGTAQLYIDFNNMMWVYNIVRL